MSSCHEDHAQGKELSSSSLLLSTRSQIKAFPDSVIISPI